MKNMKKKNKEKAKPRRRQQRRKVLLIEPAYETKFKPLGLMRISSMHKAKGNEVHFVKGMVKKEEVPFTPGLIMLTTLFTYQYPITLKTLRYYKQMFPKAEFWVGGILASTRPDLFEEEEVNIHKGLMKEAEEYPPDYSLFPDMDYSLSFISRGCVNKCQFCCVPTIEGDLSYRKKWVKDLHPNKKKVVFYDNNWLGLPWKTWLNDVKQLKKLVKDGKVTEIDFNQSLDCRLFTEKHAKALKGLPIRPMRFSFDHMGQDGFCQKAIKFATKQGFKSFVVDVLYNWHDSPEDFYYRMKEIVSVGGKIMPMKYAPLDQVNRENVGEHWTKDELLNFLRIKPYSHGEISPRTMWEFEYFFGKDAKQFKRLINFAHAKRLTKLKMKKIKDVMFSNKLSETKEVLIAKG